VNSFSLINSFYTFVWGFPLLILVMATGLYLTIVLRGIQFRYLPYALKIVFGFEKPEEGRGDISHFESLMTALAATIGIGNIAGVSMAILVGGYGAIFWMWVTALLGMATKYAESFLAIKYRHRDGNGEMVGGPMFFIEKGLGSRWLAFSFALFGLISSFGGGNMLQSNSIADALDSLASIPRPVSGAIVALFVGLTIIGGIKSIGRSASFLVPFMAVTYIGGAFYILAHHLTAIPGVFFEIFDAAFTGKAALGGVAGSSFILAMQVGVSRGLMTSEAGLGTASIAAAAAKTDVPGRQALVSMTGSFMATVVMCTISALVLGVTGVVGMTDASGKLITGVPLTIKAFETSLSFGAPLVTFVAIFFGFTTLVGWAYYGEKCIEYFLGEKSVIPFRVIFTLFVIPGAVLELDLVWLISDIANGLMAYPNLIGLLALAHVVVGETKGFEKKLALEIQNAGE